MGRGRRRRGRLEGVTVWRGWIRGAEGTPRGRGDDGETGCAETKRFGGERELRGGGGGMRRRGKVERVARSGSACTPPRGMVIGRIQAPSRAKPAAFTHCVPSGQGALQMARTWQGGPSEDSSTRRWGSIWPVLAVELRALGVLGEALAMATSVRKACREEGGRGEGGRGRLREVKFTEG